MLWTEILFHIWEGKSFSPATAPPSGRSCGVILYIILQVFPPDRAGLVGTGPADLCLSEDCPECGVRLECSECCSTAWAAGMAALPGVMAETWRQMSHWKSPQLLLFAEPSAAYTQRCFLSVKSSEKLTPAFLKFAENGHWRAGNIFVYPQNWIHILSTNYNQGGLFHL